VAAGAALRIRVEAAIVEGAERLRDEIVETYARVADPAERVSIGSRRFIRQARNEPRWAAGLLRVWSSSPGPLTRMLGPDFASLRAGRRSGRFTYDREDAAADLLVGSVAAAMLRVINDRVDERHDTAVASLIRRGIGISTSEADVRSRRTPRFLAGEPQWTGVPRRLQGRSRDSESEGARARFQPGRPVVTRRSPSPRRKVPPSRSQAESTVPKLVLSSRQSEA
jgi:hypothetical protein